MNRSLRIVFFGTPEFATTILDHIHQSHHEVVGVVTTADKPAGRGRRLQESHVKQFAVQHDLHILQPTNLKSPVFTEALQALQPDVHVVVAFRMLPKSVWAMPPMGSFNLHASLLPQYRGAAPINWAIINGENTTGVTTFFIDEKIDTGAIIDQREIDIPHRCTVGQLYGILMELGAQLTLDTLNQLTHGSLTTKLQSKTDEYKAAPKLNSSNTTINFEEKRADVDALIRGLSPYPVAKARLFDGEKQVTVKIHEAQPAETEINPMPSGSILIVDKKLYIFCLDGALRIHKIQLPNKKAMKAADLLNGYTFHPDARFLSPKD